jgi:hypothetical protein
MKHVLVATMVLFLTACGRGGGDQAASTTSATGSRPAAAGGDSVAAVLESQGTPLAQVRFVIDTRPEVGKPFHVQLIVSATVSTPPLRLVAESDRLVLDDANVELKLEAEGTGASRAYTARHELPVTAQKAGLAEVFVHLTSGEESQETLYAIPLLVAKAEPAAPAGPASDKPDPAAESDHGQP